MRIYIAGKTGLVGQAVCRAVHRHGHDLVDAPRIDLRDRNRVQELFDRPNMKGINAVVCAAARVGGIGANSADPIGFLLDNVRISTNLLEAAADREIPHFINLGSSCIYPRDCPQPIIEEYLMTGHLEPTNSGYAVAKIAALELTALYRTKFPGYVSLMPTNLYGPGDRYDPDTSHVIPALIMKIFHAAKRNLPEVSLWGTGTPLREFMHVDDLAEAIMLAITQSHRIVYPWLNVGSGEEISIANLASTISTEVGYHGAISWNHDRPDGTMRKLICSDRIRQLGWSPSIRLQDGLKQVIAGYMKDYQA